MPFSFDFKGSFFELGKFFNRLDRFVAVRNGGLDVTGRLLLLNSITLTPDTEKGFPTLTADVSANSYLLPATEGLTAGATADSPTGQRHGSAWRDARRRARPRPPRPQRSLEPPDERSQRHLALPRAAPAVAGGDPPDRRGRRRPDAAVRGARAARRPRPRWPSRPTRRRCSPTTRSSTQAADGDRSGRRQVLGARKDPFKPQGHADPEPKPRRGQGAGHRHDRPRRRPVATPPSVGGSPAPDTGTPVVPGRRRRRRRRTSSTS